MLRKLFVFTLLSFSACAFVYAQTPEPKKDYGRVVQAFSMSFDGDGGYLGIQSVEVTKENFSKFGLREVRGVAVEKIIDGSPAQTAGLLNGDVIVKFNGDDVTSTRKLSRLIGEVAPDHQAKLTVVRNGDDREITITAGKRPEPKFEFGGFTPPVPGLLCRPGVPPTADFPELPPLPEAPLFRSYPGDDRSVVVFRGSSGRRIGVSVTDLTKQLSDYFGVSNGVMVTDVRENFPAAKAGLKAGDIIVEADGKNVNGDVDLIRAITGKKEGDVTLTIVRDHNRQTINITPEEVKGAFNTLFETPEGVPLQPGSFKFAQPATPAPPVPLNRITVPGRIL